MTLEKIREEIEKALQSVFPNADIVHGTLITPHLMAVEEVDDDVVAIFVDFESEGGEVFEMFVYCKMMADDITYLGYTDILRPPFNPANIHSALRETFGMAWTYKREREPDVNKWFAQRIIMGLLYHAPERLYREPWTKWMLAELSAWL